MKNGVGYTAFRCRLRILPLFSPANLAYADHDYCSSRNFAVAMPVSLPNLAQLACQVASQAKARWLAREAEGARQGRGASLVRHVAEPFARHLGLICKENRLNGFGVYASSSEKTTAFFLKRSFFHLLFY